MVSRLTFGLLMSLMMGASACWADTRYEGQVVRVLDGDTIDVLSGASQRQRVRLANIDAPEKGQPFGQKSKQNLLKLVAGKSVEIVQTGRDQYGRDIARVLVNGREANVEQVRAGLAWVYSRYNQDPKLPSIEKEARVQRTGLWADPYPEAPWNFRRKTRTEK